MCFGVFWDKKVGTMKSGPILPVHMVLPLLIVFTLETIKTYHLGIEKSKIPHHTWFSGLGPRSPPTHFQIPSITTRYGSKCPCPNTEPPSEHKVSWVVTPRLVYGWWACEKGLPSYGWAYSQYGRLSLLNATSFNRPTVQYNTTKTFVSRTVVDAWIESEAASES